MHTDVHVSEISSGEEDPVAKKKNKDPTADLKYFFKAAAPVAGSNKARSQCTLCTSVIYSTVFCITY
jgi:hypothetical protein